MNQDKSYKLAKLIFYQLNQLILITSTSIIFIYLFSKAKQHTPLKPKRQKPVLSFSALLTELSTDSCSRYSPSSRCSSVR
ncbi:hypothetical protein RIF29_21980 [Crotalaria pallida]|uniref:Uncharacterized protein n=1 Tax=Crotalaria pallida TaxID=3830 RepID=A0AAN9I8Z1_CROPI